jgi:3-oxoacyl-[acyl-carrier protein] reductase
VELGLRGRCAVVGGASSGIGLAVAERLAEEGCNLVLWSRRESALQQIADRLHAEHGGQTLAVAADAQEAGAGEHVASRVLERFGGADIVVLNAGGPPCSA